MNSLWLAVIGMIVFAIGYRFYSKWVAEKIYRLDPNFVTPAHQYSDGVDISQRRK